MNSFMDTYYRDEETNELIKDNINLNLKLGGYLQFRKNPNLRLDLTGDVPDMKPTKTPVDLQMFFDFNEYNKEQSLLEVSNNELLSYRKTSPIEKLFTPLTPVQLFSQQSPIITTNLITSQFTRNLLSSTMNITPTNFNFDIDMLDISEEEANLIDFSDSMEFCSSNSTPESKNDIDYFPDVTDIINQFSDKLEYNISGCKISENYPFEQNVQTPISFPSQKSSKLDQPESQTLTDLIVNKFHSQVFTTECITCFHCGKSMDNVHSYILHLDEEKLFHHLKYKCPLSECPFNMIGFHKKINLRQHSLAKHFEKKTNTFICGDQYELALLQKLLFICDCNKAFCRRDSLQRHIKLLHDKNPVLTNKKRKSC